MRDDLAFLTAAELGRLIRKKTISPVEVVEATLRRIEAVEQRLHAYMTLLADAGLRAAKEAEAEIAAGRHRGPLHGVPVAVKDLFSTRGVRTTAGSKILAAWVPDYDATVIERLRAAGTILLGKHHLHEFAAGMGQINPHYDNPVNPWGPDRYPGSSSSGSAVAVAAGLCAGALGTDTGGSIRHPASLCGIVGLKPTYGRVSRFGVFPLSWSLDHAGPMTRCVEDAALLLHAIAGHDPRDASSSRAPVPDYGKALVGDIRGMRVGLLTGHFAHPMDPEVRGALVAAVELLRGLGAAIEEVALPKAEHALTAYHAIVSSEALAVHERWIKARPQDYGGDNRTRLLHGASVLATQYLQAQRARVLIRQEVDDALRRVEVLVSAALPVTAPKYGQHTVTLDGRNEEFRTIASRFIRPFNVTGHPSISVPCGFDQAGLPIGLQIVGRWLDEATVLKVAHAKETAAGWRTRRPPV